MAAERGLLDLLAAVSYGQQTTAQQEQLSPFLKYTKARISDEGLDLLQTHFAKGTLNIELMNRKLFPFSLPTIFVAESRISPLRINNNHLRNTASAIG